MSEQSFALETIEEILAKTLDALKSSQEQMWDIAESARSEHDRIRAEIAELKDEISRWIKEVDKLEAAFKQVRIRLYEVSANFERYTEKEKRETYEKADKIRELMTVARERERYLRQRRDEQERSLVRISEMVDKAEGLLSQVGIALDFLSGNIDTVNQQLAHIKTRYEIGQRIIKVQEEERRRLAREIHDGPAQDLANVVLKAEICEKIYNSGNEAAALAELGELKALVKGSLQEVRRIIYNLRPMALDDLGLIPTVKRLLEETREQTGIRTRLVVHGREERLEPSVEVALFRTIQEAVTNSKKHANPREIAVKIEFTNATIRVLIADDGKGFDIEEARDRIVAQDHFGLYGMQERIELLGGKFSIRSDLRQGTRITIALNLTERGRDYGENTGTNRR